MEFGCHDMTESPLNLKVIQSITTRFNLALVHSCFFEAFYSVTVLVCLLLVEYNKQYVTWLQGQKPAGIIFIAILFFIVALL